MAKYTELKKAIDYFVSDDGPDSLINFSKVLKSYVDKGTWVEWPGVTDNIGTRFRTVESRGKQYIAMFSDQSQYRLQKGEGLVCTDINKLIDTVFQNQFLEGIAIDPDTTFLRLGKDFFLHCYLHGIYPDLSTDGVPQRDWGEGIPVHTKEDLMTQKEMQEFAIQTVLNYEPAFKQGCERVSMCCVPGVVPSLITRKNGVFSFTLIKGASTMDIPELTDEERKRMLELGNKYKAECWWAHVNFLSADPARFDACLALKGDGFLCRFEGLQKV